MQTDKYARLSEFGRELLSKHSLEEGLPLIIKYLKALIGADRCSIFIYNQNEHRLWTTIADGVERIEVNADEGVVGYTIAKKEVVMTNDAYSHPEFLSKIDTQTGYLTKNILTAPIFDSTRSVIGVVELLNKSGGFDEEDMKFITFFAHFISGFLELVNIYEKI